jgi:hypothetical protein
MTSIPGVFAGGDCGNDKISIAIEAIADAKKASDVIDAYLYGEDIKYRERFVVTRDDITAEDFEDRERQCRPELPQLSAEERKDNFSEVIPCAYTEEQAMAEASRCLECGCHDYFECKLIDFANQYDVHPERFAGEKSTIEFNDDHPFSRIREKAESIANSEYTIYRLKRKGKIYFPVSYGPENQCIPRFRGLFVPILSMYSMLCAFSSKRLYSFPKEKASES